MPTIQVPVIDRQVVLNVAISPAGQDEPVHACRAIFDTGTQTTAISTIVVAQTRPDHVGEALMAVADGRENWTDVFWIRIRIPFGLTATAEAPTYDITASEIPGPLGGCDVLLGMDIISKWHVTLHNGQCIIKF